MSIQQDRQLASHSAGPGTAREARARTYLGGTWAFLIAQVVVLAAGLALQSTAAKGMSAADYARFALTHTVILAAAHLLCGTLPRAFARQVSLEPASLPSTWRLVFSLQLPASAVFALVLWTCGGRISGLLQDRQMVPLISLAALVIVVYSGMLEPAWHLLNGLRKHRLQATLMGTHAVLRYAAVYLVLCRRGSATWAVSGLLIAALTSTLIVVPILTSLVWHTPPCGAAKGLKAAEIWNWIRFAPAVDLANYVLIVFNLALVKACVDDADAVAVYAACFVLAQANLPICRSVSRGFFSHLAAASHAGNEGECRRLLTTVSRILVIGLSLELAVAIRVGEPFVEWFSGMPLPHCGLPVTLMLGAGLFGSAYVFSELLASAGRLRLRLLAAALYGVVGLGLNCALAPAYGVRGSAAAFLTSGLLALGAVAIASRRICDKWQIAPTMARCCLAALVSVLASGLFLPVHGIMGMIGAGGGVTAIFLLALCVLGEFSVKELRASLQPLLHRRDDRLMAQVHDQQESHRV